MNTTGTILYPKDYLPKDTDDNLYWSEDLREALFRAMEDVSVDSLGDLFRRGGKLWLLPPGSPERFETFSPTLQRSSRKGEYILGEHEKKLFFTGWDDKKALDEAFLWVETKRQAEINKWLSNVRFGHAAHHRLKGVTRKQGSITILYQTRSVTYMLSKPVLETFLAKINPGGGRAPIERLPYRQPGQGIASPN